jgi:hypothetical protein
VITNKCGFFLYRFWVLNEEAGGVKVSRFFVSINNSHRGTEEEVKEKSQISKLETKRRIIINF